MTYQDILDLINANLASGSKIPAVKHREVETALLDFIQSNVAQQYDIKAIYANSTYLGNNFESNGLGKNLRAGWAICNGNNGTPNLSGRVLIHYSADFPLGTVGGSKDAVVVEHTHTIDEVYNENSDNGKKVASGGGTKENIGTQEVSKTGESGTNKNMQPYLATVYIMKL